MIRSARPYRFDFPGMPFSATRIDWNGTPTLVRMAESKHQEFPKTHRAVRWHPPSHDVRVEDVPFPKWAAISCISSDDNSAHPCIKIRRLEDPDDAIVKVTVRMLYGTVSVGGD